MKVRFFILSLIISLNVISASSVYAENNKALEQAKISVSENTYDFGTVSQGTQVEHNFVISNLGKKPLKIEKIFTTCGCTAAVIDSDTIQAGEKTTLKVSFDTTGFSAFKSKTVRIFTSDPQQSSLLFTIQGNIIADVTSSINKLNFGEVPKGQERISKFSISTNKANNVAVKEVFARSSAILTEVEGKSDGINNIWQITVRLSKDTEIGSLRERITIKTTSEKNPVINIPVFAKILGDFRVNPTVLSLGLVEQKNSLKAQEVQISNTSKEKINILGIEALEDKVVLELKTVNDFSWIIGIKVKENVSGVLKDKIIVKTDHIDDNQQTITIPVYGIIVAQPKAE